MTLPLDSLTPDELREVQDVHPFTPEQRALLQALKQRISESIDLLPPDADGTMSRHEMRIYAVANVLPDLPEYAQNIYIMRACVYRSTAAMAADLHISRPTLTKFLSAIKRTIKRNADDFIKSHLD